MMPADENSKGSVYSAAGWLNNHFGIKSRGRYSYVADLPFRPGCRVLDLGYANGSWSRLIAERVGASGQVLGVDHDAILIEQAQNAIRGTHLEPRLSFRALDISKEMGTLEKKFDVVTMFNVGSLLDNAKENLIQIFELLNVNSGILILKDSAISSDFYWPLDAKIAGAIRKRLSHGGKIKGYDPNFALNCRELLANAGFSITEVILSSYAFAFPFSEAERIYISRNAGMIAEVEPSDEPEEELDTWLSEFLPENGSFFDQQNAIYTTTEFTYVCAAS